MTNLSVVYSLQFNEQEQAANKNLKPQDHLEFALPQNDLASLSQAIRDARAGMNNVLTTWKDAVDEKAKEKMAEQEWEQKRLQAEKEKFDKGEPDESDEEDIDAEDA